MVRTYFRIHPLNLLAYTPTSYIAAPGTPLVNIHPASSYTYILFLDLVESVVPPESIVSFSVFSIDNYTTVKRTADLPWRAQKKGAVDHGHEDKTIAHETNIRGLNIGDFFPSAPTFRQTACEKTEKRFHEQIHHRQVSVYT